MVGDDEESDELITESQDKEDVSYEAHASGGFTSSVSLQISHQRQTKVLLHTRSAQRVLWCRASHYIRSSWYPILTHSKVNINLPLIVKTCLTTTTMRCIHPHTDQAQFS